MNKEHKPVAELTQKSQAIDFTPIYYIRILSPLKKGTVIRFDVESDYIYKEKNQTQ